MTHPPLPAPPRGGGVDALAMGHPRRWWALVVLCVALGMVVIDNTILAVAIPSIARELPANETDLQWISTSYGLVLAGLLLPLAVLGDRHGRKGLLCIGLVVFGAASGVAAFASTPLQLAVARGAMGVGGACTMPATLSVLGNVFAERERGRALAVWSGTAGFASAIGPVAGGLLLAHFWWGSVFLVNVPVAILGLVGALVLVPDSRDPSARPIDGGSALAWWGALTASLVAIIEGPERGWTSPIVLLSAALAVVLFWAFARSEQRSRSPLVPLETARDPRLRWGGATISALFFAVFGVQFILTQWLQGPKGRTALEAGLYFVPLALASIVASVCNPRVVARTSHPGAAAIGLAVAAAGGFGAAIAVGADSVPAVAAVGMLVGFGIGLAAPSGTELIMSAAPPEQAGSAAGVNETLVEAGGSLGIAVCGTVLAASSSFAWALPAAGAVALAGAIGVRLRLGGGRA